MAITKQNKPATATVVNFGVSFRHLSVTENIEKPIKHDPENTHIRRIFYLFLTTLEIFDEHVRESVSPATLTHGPTPVRMASTTSDCLYYTLLGLPDPQSMPK